MIATRKRTEPGLQINSPHFKKHAIEMNLNDWWHQHRQRFDNTPVNDAFINALQNCEAFNDRAERRLTLNLQALQALQVDDALLLTAVLFMAHEVQHPDWPAARDGLDSVSAKLLDEMLNVHSADWLNNPKSRNPEGLRRLLMAMIDDVRLVLLLLSDHLAKMKCATQQSRPIQQQLAHAAMTFHAPLANRLGIWQLKWELEDLSFRFLQPDDYRTIAQQLDEKRPAREKFIRDCSARLAKALEENGIRADIAGRPKHIYSIHKKMSRKHVGLDGLYDIRAVRVLVDSVADCYATLGIVHATWKHIPREFDDYIAQPKGNMYQSLHTVVVTESGKTLEVQIRTHRMHEHAELGVAAHWKYKDGSKQDQSYDQKVNWMRQILSDQDQDSSLVDQFMEATDEHRIYVFTPNGDVLDLPHNSTPVDFAYHVHTEVGHRCQGAKVNGAIVPLNHALQTGDQIEILTAKLAKPSRDWLHEQSGYVNSPRARAKVRHWFRENEFDKNLQAGREVLDAELKKYNLQAVDLKPLLASFNLHEVDKLHAMIGSGDVSVSQVIRRAELQLNPPREKDLQINAKPIKANAAAGQFLVEGVESLKTQAAQCCQPVPGDAIGGFITRSRGISVHKADCDNFRHMIEEEPTRQIRVRWNQDNDGMFAATLAIVATDRKSFIKDLSAILANNKANIEAINTQPQSDTGTRHIQLVIQVRDFDHLTLVMNRIATLQHLQSLQRLA